MGIHFAVLLHADLPREQSDEVGPLHEEAVVRGTLLARCGQVSTGGVGRTWR